VNNKTPTRRTKGKKMLISNNNSKINSTWELTRASVDGLVKAIEAGRHEVFSSYLQTMARFHTYSARNVLLIAAQRPTATHLEGLRSWNELGRSVRPGEKGVFIFAPTVGIKNNNQSQAQDAGKKPAKGKKPADEPKAPAQPETQLLGFRGVYVFDRLSRDLSRDLQSRLGALGVRRAWRFKEPPR
jgi:hypothetical protein